MNVKYLISTAVREYSDNTAIIYGEKRYTFKPLNSRVNKLVSGLLRMGIKKGDRVAMLLENCIELIEIDFVLSKTGIIRAPLNL